MINQIINRQFYKDKYYEFYIECDIMKGLGIGYLNDIKGKRDVA